jgi:hypothetical protein
MTSSVHNIIVALLLSVLPLSSVRAQATSTPVAGAQLTPLLDSVL